MDKIVEFQIDRGKMREAGQNVKKAIDRADETAPLIDQAYQAFQEILEIFGLSSTPHPINVDRLLEPFFLAQCTLLEASEALTEAARELTTAERALYYGVILNDGTDEPTDESEAKQ